MNEKTKVLFKENRKIVGELCLDILADASVEYEENSNALITNILKELKELYPNINIKSDKVEFVWEEDYMSYCNNFPIIHRFNFDSEILLVESLDKQ